VNREGIFLEIPTHLERTGSEDRRRRRNSRIVEGGNEAFLSSDQAQERSSIYLCDVSSGSRVAGDQIQAQTYWELEPKHEIKDRCPMRALIECQRNFTCDTV
jgi:hypothetical protein